MRDYVAGRGARIAVGYAGKMCVGLWLSLLPSLTTALQRGGGMIFDLCYNGPGQSWFTGLAASRAKLLTLPCGEIMKRRKQ